MSGISGTSSYAVFVYLCICVFVFACLADGNIIFDTLEYFLFQNTREDSGTKVACAKHTNAKRQKEKYTNTQIHKYTNTAYDEVPERPNMWYIFEKRIVQGYQK